MSGKLHGNLVVQDYRGLYRGRYKQVTLNRIDSIAHLGISARGSLHTFWVTTNFLSYIDTEFFSGH
jgi:hypothetical protein